MIRPINITLNAAHPELPFAEATTFTGSPSTVFIRGVPKAVGNWSITAVQVAVIFPDNSTTTREAVESAEGVWVATIPGTTTSGRTESGFRILASGIDENGATVTGYVLGFADFSVFSLIPLPTPDAPYYYLRYFESVPASPHKGDVCYLDGVLKWYDGTAWQPIAGAPVVAPSTDPSAAGKSADAYATGTALAAASATASAADAKATQALSTAELADAKATQALSTAADAAAIAPKFSTSSTYSVNDIVMYNGVRYRCITVHTGAWDAANWRLEPVQTVLGNKQDALSAQQLANIAAVPNKADVSALRYSFNTATVYVATTSDVEIFDLADHANNTATLGSSVTTANVTLPEATTGKMRDFYIRLIIQSSAAPTITFYDPATQATVTSADIPFGASSLADIAPGDNLILFTEVEANKWLVSVKHEEAAS